MKWILRILFVFALTIGGLWITQGYYSDGYLFRNIYDSAWGNDTARIDILNTNGTDIRVLSADGLKIEYPSWCKKDNGDNCAVFGIPLTSKWQGYKIDFDVLESGKTKLMLRGPYQKEEEVLRPVLVDYKNLKINEKDYIVEGKTVWHNGVFSTERFKVKKGDKITFSFMARRHIFSIGDLKEFYQIIFLRLFLCLIISFGLAIFLIWGFCYICHRLHLPIYQVLFSFIILLILVIPVTKISNEDISERENRTLSKFPKVINNGKINSKFGLEFNDWLGDRILGRKQLIDLKSKLFYRVNGKIENDKAFMNSEDYFYSKWSIKKLSVPISDQDMKVILHNLERLSTWADKNNIKLYVLITSSKENMVLPDSDYTPPKQDRIVNFLVELANFPIKVFYLKELFNNKNYGDYTFSRVDHHWTEFGAFLGYRYLIEEMKKDFPDIHFCNEDEYDIFYDKRPRYGNFVKGLERMFYEGTGCKFLNLKGRDCPLKYSYKYYDHKMRSNLIVSEGPIPMSRVTYFNKALNNLKMTLLGHSDNGFLMSFIPFSVREVQMLRVNNGRDDEKYSMKRFDNLILNFKPDILLLTIRDWNVEYLKELY